MKYCLHFMDGESEGQSLINLPWTNSWQTTAGIDPDFDSPQTGVMNKRGTWQA